MAFVLSASGGIRRSAYRKKKKKKEKKNAVHFRTRLSMEITCWDITMNTQLLTVALLLFFSSVG